MLGINNFKFFRAYSLVKVGMIDRENDTMQKY